MAAARRLSELLQEQQEPFLVEAAKARRPRRGRGGSGGGGGAGGLGCCPAAACRRLLRLCNHGFKKRRGNGGAGAGAGVGSGLRSALSKVLCSRAMRRVLRWEDLGAGCFSGAGACGGREFRRLRRSLGDSGECDPRAMVFAGDDGEEERMGWKADMDMDVDSSRQLSPVSVLELHSDDDDSPVHSHWGDEKPSTSGSSPPSDAFLGPTSPCFTYNLEDKLCEMEVDEEEEEPVVRGGRSIEEQISSWEKIAGDISRIPAMMERDLSRSLRQWRHLEPEVREIGARIETLIFEDIRSETVGDMLASHCRSAAAATSR